MWVRRVVRPVRLRSRRSSSLANDGHPRLDMRPVLAPDHPGRQAALGQMREALMTRGYFYACNAECLPLDFIADVYRYHEALHDLPVDLKRRFLRPHGSYSGEDAGDAEPAYEAGSVASVRAWDYSRTRFEETGDQYPPLPSPVPGLGYKGFMDDLYERQDVLARALMVCFAEMLDLPSDTFAKMFDGEGGDMGTIRLLHYPRAKDDGEAERRTAANYGISPHTDFEVFTLMHQNASGLEFIPPGQDSWVVAPVTPSEFVVIVGDVLERFTNGVLKATPHRVVKTPWSRRSIIRFNAVTPDTVIEPLPQFVTAARPPAYTPVTMRKHMETTMQNLREGKGSWQPGNPGYSLTATYAYDSP
eukprot:TRINITY_DN19731_c0_g1_i1.p1 TRINITY_DN19731_c0_g1~~TRINITY_DN19731_c0_g1_i1.p1  ORF type:complete len:360 (+),score=97.30 TRINITY_DN19731_c0_g1_i1:62-1141(+)